MIQNVVLILLNTKRFNLFKTISDGSSDSSTPPPPPTLLPSAHKTRGADVTIQNKNGDTVHRHSRLLATSPAVQADVRSLFRGNFYCIRSKLEPEEKMMH